MNMRRGTFGGFILRDARKSALLRMRSKTLMVRSAAPPRVLGRCLHRRSNHEATMFKLAPGGLT
ncbi:hypothetical protein CQ10_07875 [Bradyrhizobium valentinum]|nr:hypothetical protein CQ10_07875 [Bradyrhizobium valentinum]